MLFPPPPITPRPSPWDVETKTLEEEPLKVDITRTACFTGHRHEKLQLPDRASRDALKSMMLVQILDAITVEGYDTFITGLAKGADLWYGMLIFSLKEQYPNIKLIGMSPYRGEVKHFHDRDLFEYGNVTRACDRLIFISEKYSSSCYQKRNREMVDHSSKLIGVVRDYKSGTGMTIRYAKKKGLNTNIIDLNEIRHIIY